MLLGSLCSIADLLAVRLLVLYHLHGKPHHEKQMLTSPDTLIYASFYFCVGRRESSPGHYSSSFILTPGVLFIDSIHQRLPRDA